MTFLLSKFMLFPLILIHCEEKKVIFFIIILGTHLMIIYFYVVLIDLINDYENIYSRNNNVCLGVCEYIFNVIINIIIF